MKRFLKTLGLCPKSGEIIASFSNAQNRITRYTIEPSRAGKAIALPTLDNQPKRLTEQGFWGEPNSKKTEPRSQRQQGKNWRNTKRKH
ncbi:MAG: hypothetical protein D6742_14030 [Cyanobacteria bacterium J069]|nr:MAG: hypothetical protein D6742_14030 [Cyanobacteria bacterium J069]